MTSRSASYSPRNLENVHFSPLEMSENPTPASPDPETTARLMTPDRNVANPSATAVVSGEDDGVGEYGSGRSSRYPTRPRTIATTVKYFGPYISMRTAMLVILVALVVVVVGATVAAVIIVEGESSPSDASATEDNTSPDTTTLSTRSSTTISTSPSTTSSTPFSSTSKPFPSSTTQSVSTETTSSSTSSSSSTTESSTIEQTTISTTPVSSCNASEFICANWDCVSFKLVCDGFPDCSDGSDEGIPCACSRDQFQCPNGQCVPLSAVCDGKYDCIDKGDEANCPDCAGFRCQTSNICLWDRMVSRCNGVFDCDDLTDEINCTSRSGFKYCKNGVQVRSDLFCDGLDDCGDNSDEENCVCKASREFLCPGESSKCIPSTWRCDGHADCLDGADEKNCDSCSEDAYPCFDYTCVPKSQRCNGKVDCPRDSGDEEGCVALSPAGEVQINLAGNMWPACADSWADKHSTWVCHHLHYSSMKSWTSIPPSSSSSSSGYAYLQYPQDFNGLADFDISGTCSSGATVRVSCQSSECGERKIDILESFIAGGDIAPPGKWPWVVSLTYLNKSICGGVLLDKRWVATAAHCILFAVPGNHDFSTVPFYFNVTAGSTSNTASSTFSNTVKSNRVSTTTSPSTITDGLKKSDNVQTLRVTRVVSHPETRITNNGGVDWDLALLELDGEVKMNDLVQPICLPDQGEVFTPTSYCYVAGWGLLNYKQHVKPDLLRDTRMQLWSESRCGSNIVIGETAVNTNSTICAGYLFGRPTGCQGDSGGPLMCLDPASGHYVLAGVVSRGSDRCGRIQPYTHSNRFARVSMAADWIQKVMNGDS